MTTHTAILELFCMMRIISGVKQIRSAQQPKGDSLCGLNQKLQKCVLALK